MGLDIYLTEKVYIGAGYDFEKVNVKCSITKKGEPFKLPPLNKLEYMVFEKAYWRKANHIHKWFVDNVQGGVDDCKEYWVSVEQLEELKKLCQQVVELAKESPYEEKEVEQFDGTTYTYRVYKNPEEFMEILPTQEGFFFGSTEINNWYVKDCENTLEMLKDLNENYEYYHQSSW